MFASPKVFLAWLVLFAFERWLFADFKIFARTPPDAAVFVHINEVRRGLTVGRDKPTAAFSVKSDWSLAVGRLIIFEFKFSRDDTMVTI